MKSNYRKIGDLIQLVDVRNKELKVKKLLGLSITKQFIPSVANIVGTNMRNYKIIKKNQFACSIMQVRRDKKMPVALLQDFEEAIISQAYPVFEIINEEEVLPQYLMMWMSRSEFDRHACFLAVGGVRGSLEWEDFCNMELPIPSIEKQRTIVQEYNTIVDRIKLNEQLNQKLEATAQALYKHWFVDFEFPDENGLSYKSSGGKMVWNEELEREIPKGWEVESLVSISKIKGGKRIPSGGRLTSTPNGQPYIKVADLGANKFTLLTKKHEYVPEEFQPLISKYRVSKDDLVISIVGTIGVIKIIHDTLDDANLTENCVKITHIRKINSSYLYHFLVSKEGQEEIKIRNVGAVQSKLPIYNIESFKILCPKEKVFEKFEKISSSIDNRIINLQEEEIKLFQFKDIILSKMSAVKFE